MRGVRGVRTLVLNLLASPEKVKAPLATDLSHSLESGPIHDTLDRRSGVSSPYLSHPRMAKEMLHDVRQSFASAEGIQHKDSSRSGATFVHSFDGLFIAKLLPRMAEWDDLVINLMKDLPKHANLGDGGSGNTSWPRAALGSTLLNLPVMAFKAGDAAWVVIPDSAAVRCYAQLEEWPPKGVLGASADAKACPLGKPEYFDVKPTWAHSEQRAEWDDYNAKVQKLGSCVGFMSRFVKPLDSGFKEELETVQNVKNSGFVTSISESTSFASVRWETSNRRGKIVLAILSVIVCYPEVLKYQLKCGATTMKGDYLKMACDDIALVRRGLGNSPGSVQCDFRASAIRLLACKGWLIHECAAVSPL